MTGQRARVLQCWKGCSHEGMVLVCDHVCAVCAKAARKALDKAVRKSRHAPVGGCHFQRLWRRVRSGPAGMGLRQGHSAGSVGNVRKHRLCDRRRRAVRA